VSQGEPRLGRVGSERDRPSQGFQRRPGVAERGERLPEVALRDRVLGSAPQRRPEKADRLPQVARLGQRAAVVGEKDRRLRLERQGARRVAEGLPRLAALPGDHAEQVVRVGVIRRGRSDPAVQALGAREVARQVPGHALFQQGSAVALRHRGSVERRFARGNTPATTFKNASLQSRYIAT
jgi:hypothetical protein